MVVYLKESDTKVFVVSIDEAVNYYKNHSNKLGYYPTNNMIEIINFYFQYKRGISNGKVIHVDYTIQEERKIKLLRFSLSV